MAEQAAGTTVCQELSDRSDVPPSFLARLISHGHLKQREAK